MIKIDWERRYAVEEPTVTERRQEAYECIHDFPIVTEVDGKVLEDTMISAAAAQEAQHSLYEHHVGSTLLEDHVTLRTTR